MELGWMTSTKVAGDEEEQRILSSEEGSWRISNSRVPLWRRRWVQAGLGVVVVGLIFVVVWFSIGTSGEEGVSPNENQQPPGDEDHGEDSEPSEGDFDDAWKRYLSSDELADIWESKYGAQNAGIDIEYMPRIGTSFLGKSISAVRIGSQQAANRTVVVTAGVHAREWISPAALLGAILRMTSSLDTGIISLFQQVRLLVVPLLNPDGYDYSMQHDRMWRKNLRRNTDTSCKGVDLNRNFPQHYGTEDASTFPCSETFRGESALSEPESVALQQLVDTEISQHGAQIVGFIDFHSFGGFILYPPGWGKHPPSVPAELVKELADLGNLMAERIKQESGYEYQPKSAEQLYPVGGSTDDWMYAKSTTGLSYTIELRPSDMNVCRKSCITDNGFILPESEIEPASRDVFAAILTLMEHVAIKH